MRWYAFSPCPVLWMVAGMVLLAAACDEGRLPPPGTYVAEHDSEQVITVHRDGRIAFEVRVSGAWRNGGAERMVRGEYPCTVDDDGGIHFTVSSNSTAGLDLARYRWAWKDGVIVRTDPDTGEETAFFGLE